MLEVTWLWPRPLYKNWRLLDFNHADCTRAVGHLTLTTPLVQELEVTWLWPHPLYKSHRSPTLTTSLYLVYKRTLYLSASSLSLEELQCSSSEGMAATSRSHESSQPENVPIDFRRICIFSSTPAISLITSQLHHLGAIWLGGFLLSRYLQWDRFIG